MANKSGLGYSPLTGKIYWGLQNDKGMWVGNGKKDVTNSFLQVMEHKFPVGFSQKIIVNGEHHSTIANIESGAKVYAVSEKIDFDKEMYEKVMDILGVENETEKQADFVKHLCKISE